MVEEVGGDPGGVGENRGGSRATPTTAAAADDEMSGGDVVAEIQQDGGTAGGDTLTAKVSKLLIWRSEVVCLFGHLLCLFVVRVACVASVALIIYW